MLNQTLHPDLPRIYAEYIEIDQPLVLQDDEAKHLRVLRLSADDEIHVIDGKGKLFLARLLTTGKNARVLPIELLESKQPNHEETIILIAPTKNISRFEWVIEKACEIGVGRIVPIICLRSERQHLKTDRLKRIAISAAKQSKELIIPIIDEAIPFDQAIHIEASSKWIAHCGTGNHLLLEDMIKTQGQKLIAIGPEGDFDDSEVKKALSTGYRELSLGKKRLRTETAAISAIIASTLFQS